MYSLKKIANSYLQEHLSSKVIAMKTKSIEVQIKAVHLIPVIQSFLSKVHMARNYILSQNKCYLSVSVTILLKYLNSI